MKTRRPSYGMEALRGAFSAATLRKLMELRDSGRVALARVRNTLGGDAVESDGRDLLVHVVDVLTGLPALARLHVPANVLWRKPKVDETLTVLTPADINSPGGPVAVYGDAGTDGAVPPWIDTAAGLYADEEVRVQSVNHDVVVHAKDGQQIKLGEAATKGVNREGDPITPGTFAVTSAVNPAGPGFVLTFTYTPPGGPAQVIAVAVAGLVTAAVTPPGTITFGGQTGTGSTKLKGED